MIMVTMANSVESHSAEKNPGCVPISVKGCRENCPLSLANENCIAA